MIEKIKQIVGEHEILFVCRTGSSLFCSHCDDDDLLVVVRDWDLDFKYVRTDGVCLFIYSLAEFEKMAKLQLEDYRDLYAVGLPFATGRDVLYGKNPLPNYDWWNYSEEAAKRVLEVGAHHFLSDRLFNSQNENMCLKRMVWGLVNYYAVKNGAPYLTEEQRQIVQDCHDNKLPVVYREILKSGLAPYARHARATA